MKRERGKWWVYAAFVMLTLLVLFASDPNSKATHIAAGTLSGFILVLVTELSVRARSLWFFLLSKVRYRGKLVRVSIAYLIRIKLDEEYLLIWSNLFKQFQPVGGVYKRLEGAQEMFDSLGVRGDDQIPISEETRGDLRVRLPGRNVPAFLEWFDSRKQREVGPWREFFHELVEAGPLSQEDFPFVTFRWLGRHTTGFEFSEHFQCDEVKVAEIFEAQLTAKQKGAIRRAVEDHAEQLCLADEELIRRRGVREDHHFDHNIAETAGWLLS